MSEVRHTPVRPTWVCVACGDPWPCKTRRAKFLADFAGRRLELRMTLGCWFSDALGDLADPRADNSREVLQGLHARFFGWATVARR